MNFVERYLAGKISAEDLDEAIDDTIEVWHITEIVPPLHQFLGLSYEEYQIWAMYPATLKLLLDNRKNFDNPLL